MKSDKKEETANGEPVLAPPTPSTRAQDFGELSRGSESFYPIAALSFREAKTMPESPHEYVVRTPDNEAAYVALFRAFMRSGAVIDISIGTLVMAGNIGG
jgi:hypothetical protein